MSRKKTVVYCITAVLVLVAALMELGRIRNTDFPFSVQVPAAGGVEQIRCWENGERCYVFLPSYADPAQLRLVTNPLTTVYIDGQRVENGAICEGFPLNEELSLVCKSWGRLYEGKVIFCQSGDVPTLYIDTASASMDYIHKKKGNAESGMLRLYDTTGGFLCNAQIQSINARGNATWVLDKKPYSIELNQKENLLGMGAAKKWILLANGYDDSNIRNKMCYEFAAAVGCAYSPQCQWVDLYLNGEYAGLYLLSERNEVDSQRVDVQPEQGFLVSLEVPCRWDGTNYPAFHTMHGNLLRVHHPDAAHKWIQELWNSTEDAIFSEDGVNRWTGMRWDELIDVTSWAQQHLFWEVFEAADGGCVSTYFYFDPQQGKIFGGPVWDMDGTMNLFGETPPNLMFSQRQYIWKRNEKNLFYLLWQRESYRETVKTMYREEFRSKALELVETGMDEYLDQCRTAARMNRIRWDMEDPAEEVENMKRRLRKRLDFLDEYWADEEGFYTIEVAPWILWDQWRTFAVRPGETAEFLQIISAQWMDYETGEPFDITAPVTGNLILSYVHEEEETG